MATFYFYGKDGTVTASDSDPAAPVFHSGPLDPGRAYEERGDFVGAFLTRRELANHSCPAFVESPNQTPPYTSYGLSYNQPVDHSLYHYVPSEPTDADYYLFDRHEPSENSDGCRFANPVDTFDRAGWTSQWDAIRWYPDPEEIRRLYALQDLLPFLQPERKLSALEGPFLDIIEEGTGAELAWQVPKKLLVLFLGHKVVNRFICTFYRDDVSSHGDPMAQEMILPRGSASEVGLRTLLRWMTRACQYDTMETTGFIQVPKKLFAACSLAGTMELFGLYKDARRFDKYIAKYYFVRPISAKDLECIWNGLGESSRYVYAVIKIVAERLRQHEQEGIKQVKGIDGNMFALLEQHPRLEARVRDLALNEKYRPVFGTKWIKNFGDDAEKQWRSYDLDMEVTGQDSLEKKYPDDRKTGLLEKEPQPDGPTKGVRKFGTLRIVPGDTKKPSGAGPAINELSDENQKW
ncbi:hypothetical protein Ptr902_04354 [Pyrenophora tritici-repentis]|nr:hypothetical protein Ptr902_04354 [Pyrenophora tritici-repentis]